MRVTHPGVLEKRVLEKNGAETACGGGHLWHHCLRDHSLRLGASGRGAGRDVTSAGFSFHHARSLLNERKGPAFLDRAGTSRVAASAILTRSRRSCSSPYSIASEQRNLVGALWF